MTNPAVPVIAQWAAETGFPPTLALAICAGESGFNLDAVGDNGQSAGGLQIHIPVHGGSVGTWTGTVGLRRSLREVQARWLAALGRQGPMWNTWNTAQRSAWLQDYWPRAQGCDPVSFDQCRRAVEMAEASWTEYQGASPMPVQQPAITFVPGSLSNCYPDRQGYAPEAIVLHIAEGPIGAVDSWFANPAAQAGAHFCVGLDGAIHQYFTLDRAPFANGAIEAGYTARLIDDNQQANPNLWTISCEHAGHSGDPMPAAQLDASTRLTAWLWQSAILPAGASGLALDRDHILKHGDISPRSRPRCPGWSEEFHAGYIARVQKLLAPTPAPVPVPPAPPAPDRLRQAIDDLTAVVEGLEDLRDRAAVQAASGRVAIARLGSGGN